MNKKRVADSITEQIQIIMPQDINPSQRLFGGQLLQWIDMVAAIVARRHCQKNVTTATIDNLQFKSHSTETQEMDSFDNVSAAWYYMGGRSIFNLLSEFFKGGNR